MNSSESFQPSFLRCRCSSHDLVGAMLRIRCLASVCPPRSKTHESLNNLLLDSFFLITLKLLVLFHQSTSFLSLFPFSFVTLMFSERFYRCLLGVIGNESCVLSCKLRDSGLRLDDVYIIEKVKCWKICQSLSCSCSFIGSD